MAKRLMIYTNDLESQMYRLKNVILIWIGHTLSFKTTITSYGLSALREIEKLIDIPVENDLDNLGRTRLGHLATFYQEFKHRMNNEYSDDSKKDLGLVFMGQKCVQTETSTYVGLSETPTASVPPATRKCSSPELGYSKVPSKALCASTSNNNPYLMTSLLHNSLPEPPDNTITNEQRRRRLDSNHFGTSASGTGDVITNIYKNYWNLTFSAELPESLSRY